MPRPANPEVRSRLLLIGADIVRSQGFNATGVQEITARAGVPKGSFYNYFPSKEAFAVEILDAYWTTIVDLHGPILQDSGVTPLQRIERYFAALAAFHERQGFAIGCLVGNLALELTGASEEARLKLLAIFRQWTDALADCIGAAKTRDEIPSGKDPHQLARALIDAFEGAVMRAKVERNAGPFQRFQDLVLPCLLR